jgi:hypothetical protein
MNGTTQTCPACHGQGVVTNVKTGDHLQCPRCDGDGEIQKKFHRRLYDFIFPRTIIIASTIRQAISVQVPKDYDFEWWDTVADYTSALLQLSMEINAVSFMNTNVPGNTNGIDIANWAGTAQLPYARRFPFVLSKGDQAVLYCTDLSGFNNTVQVVFRGFQLIPVQGS